MRAKKGTRIATATELLFVETLVSGSVSVMFSLTLKPGKKNIAFTQRICKIFNMLYFIYRFKKQMAQTDRQNGIIERYVSSAGGDDDDDDNEGDEDVYHVDKQQTQQPVDEDGSRNDHTDNHYCDCDNLVEDNRDDDSSSEMKDNDAEGDNLQLVCDSGARLTALLGAMC